MVENQLDQNKNADFLLIVNFYSQKQIFDIHTPLSNHTLDPRVVSSTIYEETQKQINLENFIMVDLNLFILDPNIRMMTVVKSYTVTSEIYEIFI